MPKTSDEKKRDEALKRALNTPPMRHKPLGKMTGDSSIKSEAESDRHANRTAKSQKKKPD